MSYEVHITRGAAFGEAGANPITLDEWRAEVAKWSGTDWAGEEAHGPHSARLAGGTILRWDSGIVAATSPRNPTVLLALSNSLGGRIFGEDGIELGLDRHDEVVRAVATGFPAVDTHSLTQAHCQALLAVSDPTASERERAIAQTLISRLGGLEGRAALAFLICRAVECAGDPEREATEAAAMLLHIDPGLVARLRVPPLADWVAQVERLARRATSQSEPSREPRTVVCACGRENRIPAVIPAGKRARCGQCKAPLSP